MKKQILSVLMLISVVHIQAKKAVLATTKVTDGKNSSKVVKRPTNKKHKKHKKTKKQELAHQTAIYNAQMDILDTLALKRKALEAQEAQLKSQMRRAKTNQRHTVLNTSKTTKQQALIASRHATPHSAAKQTADQNLGVMHGTIDSPAVKTTQKKMSTLEKALAAINGKIQEALKAAKNAALAIDHINHNHKQIKAFRKARKAAFAQKVSEGSVSDATPVHRLSNTMADVKEIVQPYYDAIDLSQKAQDTLDAVDKANKVNTEKIVQQKKKQAREARRTAKKSQKKAKSQKKIAPTDKTLMGGQGGLQKVEHHGKW